MNRVLLAVLATALLAACGQTPSGRRIDSSAFKTVAIEQIALWNSAGIDPLQADPATLALMAALCGTATSLSTVMDPGVPDTGPAAMDFCAVVAAAAAPAG